MPEGGDGFGWDLISIGVGYGEMSSGGGEGCREEVAGLFGADEKHVGGFVACQTGLGEEGLGEGFGDVARGDKVHLEPDGLDRAGSGGADDGYPAGDGGEVVEPGAAVEGVDGVGAGEDEPVVGTDGGERGVEGGEGFGRGELDGGDEDGRCAEGLELSSEGGGLLTSAGDEDPDLGERHLE